MGDTENFMASGTDQTICGTDKSQDDDDGSDTMHDTVSQ